MEPGFLFVLKAVFRSRGLLLLRKTFNALALINDRRLAGTGNWERVALLFAAAAAAAAFSAAATAAAAAFSAAAFSAAAAVAAAAFSAG